MADPIWMVPLRFDPRSFRGARARQHAGRQDLFQQLVCEVLQESFGPAAAITPTSGPDGRIDAFIESCSKFPPWVPVLPLPLIVECKDNDDSGKNPKRAIRDSWTEVKDQLTEEARKGWPARYAPWQRARGYLYCVSAVLPDQAFRDELQTEMQTFFASLRPLGCMVEEIHLADWTDIAVWLKHLPTTHDRWVGVGLSGIVPHAAVLAGLAGFQRYLTNEHLPFVPPSDTQKTHPARLMHWLEVNAGTRGALIVGAGGVGKTRTAMEVAGLADAQGWRVLHIRGGEPGVTVNDVSDTILPFRGRVLLVLDYLEKLQSLDLETVRERLLPEAAQREIIVALLANARLSFDSGPHEDSHLNDERTALFEPFKLVLAPDHRQQIADGIMHAIAPNAVAKLGILRFRALCGERPIIAMFVARELERRALEGTLHDRIIADLRSGDLLGWLRKRLAQDELRVRSTHLLRPAKPEPTVIAAAVALAASPCEASELERTVDIVLQTLDPSGAADARYLTTILTQLGWLERSEDVFTSAHDVVADELLEEVLHDRAVDTMRKNVFQSVMLPALTNIRVLDHFAVALERLLGTYERRTGFGVELASTAEAWLEDHATDLGARLAGSPPQAAAFVLGTILQRAPWDRAALRKWDVLLTPWLATYGDRPEARQILHPALRATADNVGAPVIDAACVWLRHNGGRRDASYVLHRLLKQRALKSEQVAVVRAATIKWLTSFATSTEAEYVFNAALRSKYQWPADLLFSAFEWHHQRRSQLPLEREFLLNALIRFSDVLTAEQRTTLVEDALMLISAGASVDDIRLRRTAEGTRYASGIRKRIKESQAIATSNATNAGSTTQRVHLERLASDTDAPIDRDFVDSVLRNAEGRLARGLPASAGYDVPHLLVVTQRLNDESLLRRVAALSRGILAHPALQPAQRTGFVSATQHAHLEQLANEPATRIDRDFVAAVLHDAEGRLASNLPASAGYVVPHLLVVTLRLNDDSLLQRVAALSRKILLHPAMQPPQRLGFVSAVRRLVEKANWVAVEDRLRILRDAGVHPRPAFSIAPRLDPERLSDELDHADWARAWVHQYERYVAAGHDLGTLVTVARAWLPSHHAHKLWASVFVRLAAAGVIDEPLTSNARLWLANYPEGRRADEVATILGAGV